MQTPLNWLWEPWRIMLRRVCADIKMWRVCMKCNVLINKSHRFNSQLTRPPSHETISKHQPIKKLKKWASVSLETRHEWQTRTSANELLERHRKTGGMHSTGFLQGPKLRVIEERALITSVTLLSVSLHEIYTERNTFPPRHTEIVISPCNYWITQHNILSSLLLQHLIFFFIFTLILNNWKGPICIIKINN